MPKKILVIDDDPVISELLKNRLEKQNYSVVVAHNGEEGLVRFKSESPDLIILDIKMPKMDGYTFLLEFKKAIDVKTVPIIVLTNKDTMQDLFKLEGVRDYILKPFKMEELLKKIEGYLKS